MQVDEIRRLVKLVEESAIDELEVRRWWTVVRILKRGTGHKGEAPQVVVTAAAPAAPAAVAAPVAVESAPPVRAAEPASTAAPAAAPAKAEASADEGLVAIKSPMVGTFYRAPNPTAPPFVDVGTRVEVGRVVCIVEAMKLMNEIETETAGTIERVLLQNGQPVEFNQPLFLIRPA